MTLDRPIVFLDVESTGVDPVADRIVSFAAVVLMPGLTVGKRFYSLYKPGFPIPAQSTAIHGITDEMVKDSKPFEDDAPFIAKALNGKDIGGYNVRFDLAIMDEAFRRAGTKLELDGVSIIDCFRIFQIKDPRDLAAAVRKFCQREPTGSHRADSDAADTLDVFLGQIKAFPDLAEMTVPEVSEFCLGDSARRPVDVAGKLYRDADGDVRYAFGKAKDVKIRDDSGFGEWILRCSNPPFPGSTRDAINQEFERLRPTPTAPTI